MITEKEFEKLSLKEQVKYFEGLGIDFIVENSAEKVLFDEKEESDDMLIGFYDNKNIEWGKLKRLSIWCNFINSEYEVITAKGSYKEEARLIPIKKFCSKDLFKEYEKEDAKRKAFKVLSKFVNEEELKNV